MWHVSAVPWKAEYGPQLKEYGPQWKESEKRENKLNARVMRPEVMMLVYHRQKSKKTNLKSKQHIQEGILEYLNHTCWKRPTKGRN
jgi:hypothetical protein